MRALVAVALLGLAPAAAAAQVSVASPAAERLRVTTTSEEASRYFWAGLADGRNVFFSRATTNFDRAIAGDGNLGLARVLRAWFAPGLTQAERIAEIDRAIATMRTATTNERLIALAVREFPDRQRSHALWKAAAKLLPGDPNVAFYAASTSPAPGNVAALRAVTEQFPEDAPTYNSLAYILWQQGDREGGFTAVRRYVELAPNEPNSHDSYAELLQWSGRYTEALAHYGRSLQLDSSYVEAHMGIAEVLQLTGRGAEARRQIQQAIARAPAKAVAIGYTRALARSFLLDGLFQEAMEQFASAAREAQTLNRPALVAAIHRDMAFADAQSGRGTTIAAHLSSAAEASRADDPLQVSMTAASYAVGGDIAAARQATQKLTALAQADSQYATRARIASAIIALRDNKPKDALAQLAGAPIDDAWVRTLTAECYVATGNTTDARTLKNQVMTDPQLDLENGYSVSARIRAAKIKV